MAPTIANIPANTPDKPLKEINREDFSIMCLIYTKSCKGSFSFDELFMLKSALKYKVIIKIYIFK